MSLMREAVLPHIVAIQAVDINQGSQEALFQDMYLDSLEMPATLSIQTENSIARSTCNLLESLQVWTLTAVSDSTAVSQRISPASPTFQAKL